MALNLKSLLTKIVENILPKTGGTMTGDLKTSFKSSSLIGSKLASSTTVSALLTELNGKYQMGSVSLSAYTSGGTNITAGWYNYISLNDKILLFGMVDATQEKMYIVSSTHVAELQPTNKIVKSYMTNGTTTNYNLNGTAGTHFYYVRVGNKVTINFNIKCTTPASNWTTFASGAPKHSYASELNIPLGCETNGAVYKPLYLRITSAGSLQARGGTAGQYYYGSFCYITNEH